MFTRCVLPALVLSLSAGCSDEVEPEHSHPPLSLELPFEARVGAEVFSCGASYQGLGTSATSYAPADFRLYVHDLRLVTGAGAEVALEVANDGEWQRDGVVLLDFADGSGQCETATAGTHTAVAASAPGGHYRGLRFRVGVPEALNHADVSTAAAPLADPGLYWGWRSGYLFTRIDGKTSGQPAGYPMHLGSTDCLPPAEGQGAGACARENRPEIDLRLFNPEGGKVVLDLAALFADTDLNADADVPNTAVGCMSQQEDPDCAPLFARLGLGFGDAPPAPAAQTFFRAE